MDVRASKAGQVSPHVRTVRGGVLASARISRRVLQMSGRERSRQLWFLLGALAVLFLCCKPVHGQSSAAFTATLSGRVVDPAGLAVKGATVTLTSAELSISRTTESGDSGLYSFTFVPAGVYILETRISGFKQYRQEGIT